MIALLIAGYFTRWLDFVTASVNGWVMPRKIIFIVVSLGLGHNFSGEFFLIDLPLKIDYFHRQLFKDIRICKLNFRCGLCLFCLQGDL
jgi:hypothetical protein